MCESIHKTKPAVAQTLLNMGTDAPVEFNGRDWELLRKIVIVLKPFKDGTLWLSKSDAAISLAIPMITTIRKTLEVIAGRDHGVMGMKRDLTDALDNRFMDMESNMHYAAATILDSKYKHYFFQDSQCAEDAKTYIVDKIITDLAQDDSSHQVICDKPCVLQTLPLMCRP